MQKQTVTVELSAADRKLLRSIAEALKLRGQDMVDFAETVGTLASVSQHTNDGTGVCAKCEADFEPDGDPDVSEVLR